MKKIKSLLPVLSVAVLSIFLTISCNKSKDDSITNPDVRLGKVEGIVHAPNKQTPIPGATVSTGNYSTITDYNGHFSFSIPEGNQTVTIKTGKGKIFKTTLTVNAVYGQTILLNDSLTVLKQVGSLAYIPGIYDQIETIIIDSLGYSATALTVADLSNPSSLSGIQGLFLNCGKQGNMDSAKYMNLQNFVDVGGSIYASDFAVEYITGDGNWFVPPTHSNMNYTGGNTTQINATCISPLLGGFIDDSVLCTQKMGPMGTITNVQILDTALISFLNKSTTDIYYDLGGWEVVHSYDAPFYVVMSDANMGALALATHINENHGRIFFTTFHNNPQGTISQDVKHILEYFILNL